MTRVFLIDLVLAHQGAGRMHHLLGERRGPVAAERHFFEQAIANARLGYEQLIDFERTQQMDVDQQARAHRLRFLVGDAVFRHELVHGQGEQFFHERRQGFVVQPCGGTVGPVGTELRCGKARIAGHGDQQRGFRGRDASGHLLNQSRDVLAEDCPYALRRRAVRLQRFAHAHGTKPIGIGVGDLAVLQQEQLCAAAADVDHERLAAFQQRLVLHHALRRGVGQSILLGLVDGAHAKARGDVDAIQECIAILRFAYRTGGDGLHLVGLGHAIFLHHLAEALQDVDAFADGGLLDAALGEGILPERYATAQGFEHGDIALFADLRDLHADRGGADVDDGHGASGSGCLARFRRGCCRLWCAVAHTVSQRIGALE